MQEEKQVKQKPLVKKKIKNKGWGTQQYEEPKPTFQSNPSSQEHSMMSKYQGISQMSNKYQIDINSILGQGFGSTVYLGKRISDSTVVCMKAIDFMAYGSPDSPYITLIHQEIESLQKFKNEQCIVNLYDVYQSPTFCYLVMEFCQGGDLYKMIKMAPYPLPINFVNIIMNQIVSGVKVIHEKGLIHRDLKTENIFVVSFPQKPEEKIKVKIGDLGFCVHKDRIVEPDGKQKPLNLGSPIYMSPQVFLHHKYSQSSDVYALGIIWYELLHKIAPWQATTEDQLIEKKLNQPIAHWREDIDETLKNFISKCVNNQPDSRPTCSELLSYFP